MSSDGGCGSIAGGNRGGRLFSGGAAKIGRVNCDDGGGGREICGGGGVVGRIPS